MRTYYFTLLMIRLVLPAGLLLSIALRPFGLSLIYLLLYLISPLVQVPNSSTKKGSCLGLLFLNILVTVPLLVAHLVWHTVMAVFPPYGSLLEDHPLLQQIGHNLGFVSYDDIDPIMAVQYLAPELVMALVSVVVYVVVQKLTSRTRAQEDKKDSKYQQYPTLTSAGKYFSLFLIMFSGIMQPSVTSGIYFLVFMGAATAWALGQPLARGFAVVGRCVMAIMAVHVLLLLAYQCTWLIELYPPDMDMARYFGLTKLVVINETDPNSFSYVVTNDQKWSTLASPFVILFTYLVLAIETRELFKPKAKRKCVLTGIEAGRLNGSIIRGVSFQRINQRANRERWMRATKKMRVAYKYINSKALSGNTSEATPLMSRTSNSPPKRSWVGTKQASFRQLQQDSTGSVVMPDEDSLDDMEEPTLMDDIMAAIVDFFQVLVRSSYIATTITMMAWSIMFHSWLTFVFLMWANVVWLRQNQRSFMLKTSPVLVFYAMALLIVQYIYGMNLTEDELPSNNTGVNLRQIGVGRVEGEPCVPLLIKSLFTCMFWVTLRQRVQEIRARRQSAVISDMAAPLQLTVSTAASVVEAQREEEYRSRLLRVLGVHLRSLCARYWIYVVVIMLFVIGITGERMTIFRIIYMFLFLVFILMFQISWYYWRRLMYMFWITVIIYSMINLILIYVYQFDNFSKAIETYLLINQKLQHDLGLDTYHPADLFVKLLTPTLFLIITIMQVHYFHKDFMAISDPKTTNNSAAKDAESSRQSQAGASTMKDDEHPRLPLDERPHSNQDPDYRNEPKALFFATALQRTELPRSTYPTLPPEEQPQTSQDPDARNMPQYPTLPPEEQPHTSQDPDARNTPQISQNRRNEELPHTSRDSDARNMPQYFMLPPEEQPHTSQDPHARNMPKRRTWPSEELPYFSEYPDPRNMREVPPLPLEEEARQTEDIEARSATEADHSLGMSSAYTQPKKARTHSRSYAGVTESRGGAAAFRSWMSQRYDAVKSTLHYIVDKIFLYLYIHLIKILFIALMLLCVCNVCAMHVPIMVIISPALWLKASKQRFCVLIISVLICVYLMAQMVYQIDYIQHSFFVVDCLTVDANGTELFTSYNNAEWIGFHKLTEEKPLAVLVKGYIGLICAFTFYSLVTYRHQTKSETGKARLYEKIMFPEVTRAEADRDMMHCTKYLINYGFYKFGVEITLMCLIGVIGSRMDLYAVLYSGWLLVLVSLKRPQQARVWPTFCLFVGVLVPVQYALAVGFLPQFCLKYPWSGHDQQMKHIRTWLFLPYADEPPHALKLVFDYFLLLFATRQLRVFKTEYKYGDTYWGGSNSENIGKDWETPQFVNPVPDFLGYVGTWLDVIKRMVFLGMLWVTLAIMFMTGTNRVNLFSMGYLIGSFIFLWQGTDFYLRPKEVILLWWSWLLRYNVSVVVVKSLLQIPGCIFSSVLQEHACWLVQLLGIGCVDKFAGGNIARFLRMQYAKDASCSVPQEDIGLAWDGVCFAFLILQRRLFNSYYFYRVIDESKATTVLASRGAELIEELRQKQMQIQEDQEVKILEKIKVKMERIKANQKKIQGAMTKEPPQHDAEEEEEETQQSERVPLVRGDSEASRGFHTPDSPSAASPRGFHTPVSEASAPPSPAHSPPPGPLPALPPPPSSQGGPPSPSSALMTVSLEAYLEPRRISFGSPPSSELLPRAQSPEESYPVFSPPPIRRRHTLASPSVLQRSVISHSSRAEPNSHHTSRGRPQYRQPTSHQKAVRSGDYYMFDEFDDTEVQMKADESSEDEDAPKKEMGIGKLLSTVIKTDLKRAVSMRRASAPAVRTARQHSFASYPSSYPHERRGDRESPDETTYGGGVQPLSERDREGPPSEIEEYAAEPEETWFDKLKRYVDTAWVFIASFLVTLTRHVMKYSRDYRYVSRTLSVEKKILKEKVGFGMGIREGSQMIWEPFPEALAHHPHRKLSDISVPEIRILAPSMERGLDASPPPPRHQHELTTSETTRRDEMDDDTSEHESAFSLQSSESKDVTTLEEQDDSMFKQGKSPLVYLVYAVWYAVLAHTDIVCYIMVFINQIQSATILSIPLPLMVFMWGTLTIPRPTKTFWVTLIAYTEVIVLIKSMFQFEILPWNQKVIPASMPFTAPRIIGIERKFNYALYDLLLLLIIFLHRFMLKSLGLWKESTPEIELREDMIYHLTEEDTQMVVEGREEEVGKKYVKLHNRTGPRHRLVDRLYHVQATIADAMRELSARRSDPRVATLVCRKLQEREELRQEQRRYSRRSTRALTREPERRPAIAETEGDSALEPQPEKSETEQVVQEVPLSEDEAGPSKPSDDDHYKVDDDQEPIIAVTTVLENTYGHYPKVILLSLKRYLRPTKMFFKRMLAPGARVTADVYAYMFLCDFFNFLVVIFGFAAFGTHQGDGGVQAYLEENKVPIPFLVMLILQFALIIIDRALYLRKFMLGKILFQYALIVGVHVWMFFVLPFITERTFNALVPPPMWYMMKCIYLLLSAYQIRCGYPRRIIGNFLCKSYHFLNMLFFRGFMAVPFVFELRTLMDWIWTDTSMTLMDWLKMEDIFASVFLLKCSRYVEDEYPQPRGVKKKNSIKYLLGGSVLAFVIAIIWFPLVFFAVGNTVGKPNPPTDVTVKLRIGPYLPVYQMSAQSHNIDVYTEQDYTQLSNLYGRDRTAQTFLSNYMYNDVAVISINPNSTMTWDISPPELARLEKEAMSNDSLVVKFTYVITHPTNAVPNPPTIEDSRVMKLEAYVDGAPNPERDTLVQMLKGTAPPDAWLTVKTLFPKFVKVFNKGTAKPTFQLLPPTTIVNQETDSESDETRIYRDVKLRLERENGKDSRMYWRVHEACSPREKLRSIPMNNCDMLVMFTFNDKLFPETLNFISGSGIIGLYTTFVFLASRILRGFFSGIYTKIMFDDLPNVDRVLQLCLDIYLVREALELALEEDLFAKLVFLYRSPETMIKWSRPKEEPEEQRALPPSR